MGAVLGQAAPRDGGDPSVAGVASPGNIPSMGLPVWEPLVGNLSRVKCLLDEWAPPQNWGRVEIPEVMELALHEIGDCLGALRGCVAAGIVGWLFLETLKRVTQERDALWCPLG